MFKFKFLPICRAHSMAVPHPAAFPSAKYTVSPPIFHPTSGYRPGKKKRTCFDAIKIFIYRLFMEPSRTMISTACVASVSVRFRSKKRGTRVKDRAKNCAIKRAWVSIHFSRSQNRKSWFLGLSLRRNQTETLATHAVISLLIWVVTCLQYGISALVSQTSFRGENSCGITKC